MLFGVYVVGVYIDILSCTPSVIIQERIKVSFRDNSY